MPLYVEGFGPNIIGYAVPISPTSLVSAAHLVKAPSLIWDRIKFYIADKPCVKVLVCTEDADICVMYVEGSTFGDVEIAREEEYSALTNEDGGSRELTLHSQAVVFKSLSEKEVKIGWEDWIKTGMSGSGIYLNGKLLAILSRIKRGEYAIGTLVSPYLVDMEQSLVDI